MKSDITNRADIVLLVDTFYKKVKQDDVIGHFFTKVIELSWEKHMPIMYDFWETLLLSTAGYAGNVMQPHINLDKMSAIDPEHFDRWLLHWTDTVNDLFAGFKADEAVSRAQTMAYLINNKVVRHRNDSV